MVFDRIEIKFVVQILNGHHGGAGKFCPRSRPVGGITSRFPIRTILVISPAFVTVGNRDYWGGGGGKA